MGHGAEVHDLLHVALGQHGKAGLAAGHHVGVVAEDEHPNTRGSHENGDIFFQHREACNKYYDALPSVVEK